eukprot:gene9201-biopygen16709
MRPGDHHSWSFTEPARHAPRHLLWSFGGNRRRTRRSSQARTAQETRLAVTQLLLLSELSRWLSLIFPTHIQGVLLRSPAGVKNATLRKPAQFRTEWRSRPLPLCSTIAQMHALLVVPTRKNPPSTGKTWWISLRLATLTCVAPHSVRKASASHDRVAFRSSPLSRDARVPSNSDDDSADGSSNSSSSSSSSNNNNRHQQHNSVFARSLPNGIPCPVRCAPRLQGVPRWHGTAILRRGRAAVCRVRCGLDAVQPHASRDGRCPHASSKGGGK